MSLLIRQGWLLRQYAPVPPQTQRTPINSEQASPIAAFLRKDTPEAFQADILIQDGRIQQIGICEGTQADRVVDASEFLVTPGFIDVHVHLREPGREDKETIQTGTHAAAMGGFTTVACMPNTQPAADSPETLAYILNQAAKYGSTRVCPIASITRELAGVEATDWLHLLEAGACGFSDDGRTVMNAEIMRRLLELSADRDFPVISHCEDHNLAGDGVIHAGEVAKQLGVPGISHLVEDTIVARDIALAEETGGHIHVAHVSTRGAVEHIRQGKARGVHVTGEASPHHLLLTDETVLEHGANAKMNPPLRSREDVDAVVEGLRDGTLDVIATDHAPHAPFEKAQGLVKAPFGIVGSETCVPLILTKLVQTGRIPLERAVDALTKEPALILGLQTGGVETGAQADLTLIDLNHRAMVDPTKFLSKSRNTPFVGWELQGWPAMTILEGKVTAQR